MSKPPYIITVNNLWFFPRWVEGVALYPFIFLKHNKQHAVADAKTLLEHEKVHIEQQLRGWIIGFYIKYLYYNWKYGYEDNPYEVEARKHEDDWKRVT